MFSRLLATAALAAAALTPVVPAVAQDAPVAATNDAYTGPLVYEAEVVATYPHDPDAFTQGLLWHDGALYESTGREFRSVVRKVDLETGEVLQQSAIPAGQFGEGLAVWEDEFVSLTWQDKAIHRWDTATLAPVSSAQDFPFEGWGLTTSPEGLIHSDGSATLRVLDPDSYEVRRTISVTMNGRPVRNLNELELIDGLVYANIWHTPFIVAIDPATGVVRQLIDLRAIVAQVRPADGEAVLNGIAFDADNRRLFVTGKLWPSLFEIRLVETNARVR